MHVPIIYLIYFVYINHSLFSEFSINGEVLIKRRRKHKITRLPIGTFLCRPLTAPRRFANHSTRYHPVKKVNPENNVNENGVG